MARSIFDLLWPWRSPSTPAQAQAQAEAKSPAPKDQLPLVEPIGFGQEMNPMDKASRKDPAALVNASLQAAQARTRDARYKDFRAMDASDIAAMLDAVVDAVLTFEDVGAGRGFKVESDNKAIHKLLNRAKVQADLEQLAEEILRDILKWGDGFVEPLFAGPELVGAQTYLPEQIFVTRDDKSQLAKGKDDNGIPIAFQQKRNGAIVAGWQPWEMIHFKYWPSRKLLYSEKSLLDGLRADWRKLQLVEQGMVVARITRAYQKRVHYVDVTGKNREDQEDTLRKFVKRMMQKNFAKKPTNTDDSLPIVDVSDDLFISTGYMTGSDGKPYPMLNKTEVESPAIAGLSELGDVDYLRGKLWVQVPSDVVGIKRSTSGDLDNQDLAFVRLIRRCQKQLERGLRAIFDQVLLANGRLPNTVEYRIILPIADAKSSWKFADARFKASLTLRNYGEMGAISRRFMLKQAYNLTDEEIDAVWKEVEDEMHSPVFQALINMAAARNGMPTFTGTGSDSGTATAPEPAGTAPNTVTKNGIDRGTPLGQATRGNMSGGSG